MILLYLWQLVGTGWPFFPRPFFCDKRNMISWKMKERRAKKSTHVRQTSGSRDGGLRERKIKTSERWIGFVARPGKKIHSGKFERDNLLFCSISLAQSLNLCACSVSRFWWGRTGLIFLQERAARRRYICIEELPDITFPCIAPGKTFDVPWHYMKTRKG